MGQMRIQYQKKNDAGGNYFEFNYGEAGRLNYLLQVRPNPLMTASILQEQIVYRCIYYGNAYVYIERGEVGEVKALYLCTGGGYNPLSDKYTLTYNTRQGPRMRVETDSRNVLHFKNVILTDDYYAGVPVLDCAITSLSIAATGDDQALKDVAKGGRHKVLLQEEKSPAGLGLRGKADKTELKNLKRQFADDWAANDVVMVDNVVDTKIISQTSQQLQLLEQRKYSVSDLARVLGVPTIMMMEDGGSNYKMPEHATQEFLLRTIQPRIREWEDELNSKLLNSYDFGKRRIHVCELALRRLDAKGQAEIDKIHLETGVCTVNELRNQYDYPSVKGGDLNYISTNLAELGSKKLSDEPSNGSAGAGEGEGE